MIDHAIAIYGSYNFLKSGTMADAENVILIENKKIVSKLYNEFLRLKSMSDNYQKLLLISKFNLKKAFLYLQNNKGIWISIILNILLFFILLRYIYFNRCKD
ncbi:hypothetical protein EZS27_008961 [termite gut metagenome]|uniref:Phospholipase D-like domain-containing protein n=1 Tax=termite gut metagenome TaxID=433724 RepID=A0A5J4SDG4_9ZZZZ